MPQKIRRIGILTGGGDCPGLNAVIRAVVKACLRTHQMEVVGILDGYEGLVQANTRVLTDEDVSGILSRGGTILGTSNRANPFQYPVKRKDGSIAFEDRSGDALRSLEKLKLEALIAVGGDGTLSIANQLAGKGVAVVGVPKTIDNDLEATDVTFGFDSALWIATDAVDRLHSTAESHHRVMVLEVMGRYAGWIALRSGIAGGGDIILIPEIPYQTKKVCEAVEKRVEKGKRFSIVVVAEGARAVDGEMIVRQTVPGSPDPVRLGGVGEAVARQIEERTHLESRVTVLGHLQRGGIPTPFDRWLATRFGVAASELLVQGSMNRMVCLRGLEIASVPLKEAIQQLRRVSSGGSEVQASRSVGTCFGD